MQVSSEKKRKEEERTKTTIIGIVANKERQDPLTVPCSKLEVQRSAAVSQNERPTPICDAKMSNEDENVTAYLKD